MLAGLWDPDLLNAWDPGCSRVCWFSCPNVWSPGRLRKCQQTPQWQNFVLFLHSCWPHCLREPYMFDHVCPLVPKHLQEMLNEHYIKHKRPWQKQFAPCGWPLDRLLELGLCNATILKRRGYWKSGKMAFQMQAASNNLVACLQYEWKHSSFGGVPNLIFTSLPHHFIADWILLCNISSIGWLPPRPALALTLNRRCRIFSVAWYLLNPP